MFRAFCCGARNEVTVLRMSIAQIVLYGALIAIDICGCLLIDLEDADSTRTAENMFFAGALLNIMPLILAVLLCVGVLREKYYYLRLYIFAKIFETIINTLVFLSSAIFISMSLEYYYGILMCALPILIGIWMIECVVIVNVFYNTKTKSPSSNKFADPEDPK